MSNPGRRFKMAFATINQPALNKPPAAPTSNPVIDEAFAAEPSLKKRVYDVIGALLLLKGRKDANHQDKFQEPRRNTYHSSKTSPDIPPACWPGVQMRMLRKINSSSNSSNNTRYPSKRALKMVQLQRNGNCKMGIRRGMRRE